MQAELRQRHAHGLTPPASVAHDDELAVDTHEAGALAEGRHRNAGRQAERQAPWLATADSANLDSGGVRNDHVVAVAGQSEVAHRW
jgi:hypothetical protein